MKSKRDKEKILMKEINDLWNSKMLVHEYLFSNGKKKKTTKKQKTFYCNYI